MDPKMVPEFDPQNGVQKWHPKMVPEFDPQYSFGLKKSFGTQKGGPIFFWFKKDLQEIKAVFKILGLPFGCHFWTPFWGSNSGTIFGSIFQPFGGQILAPFLGPFFNLHFGVQRWCKICKSVCCQSCIAKLFPASKHAYQNASVVIPSYLHLSTQFNSTWSSLPE